MKRIQDSIVMSQQEWLNIAVVAKWIPETLLKTAPTRTASSTGLQKTARIDNVRFANGNVALTPQEWEQIGMRTGWLEKEAGLMDWWRERQQKRQEQKQQQQQQKQIRRQVNQNVDQITGDVIKAQNLIKTIYKDSVNAFGALKKVMEGVKWLAGMDPQGQVLPTAQVQAVEKAIQSAETQVTGIAQFIGSLKAEPNIPEANLRGAPARPSRKRKTPAAPAVAPVAPVKDEVIEPLVPGPEAGLPVAAKSTIRLIKSA